MYIYNMKQGDEVSNNFFFKKKKKRTDIFALNVML